MADCIFCKIGAREIQAMVIYEDAELIGFRDINPQAPVHVLLIPKRHCASLDDCGPPESGLLGRLLLAAKQIARQEKLSDRGYRLVLNVGDEAGQVVKHLHMHLIGGREMKWPPG
ncbi:MAG: HIT domain-containing protein [Planctomycetota bacterium]